MPRPSRRSRLALATLLAGVTAVGIVRGLRESILARSPHDAKHSPSALAAMDAITPRFTTASALVASHLSGSNGMPPRSSSALFDYAPPADALSLDLALPAPTRAIHYVRLNLALIAGKRSPFWQKPGVGRVELPLPEGGTLSVVIEESTMLGADRFTSMGHIEGRPQSRAVFAWNAGFLHASIDDAGVGSYALRAATENLAQFYRVDPALAGTCGGERRPVIDAATLRAAMTRRARASELATSPSPLAATNNESLAAAVNPQRAEVHVMMAYTPAVLTTLSGAVRTAALQSAFDAAIAKVNSDLAVSGVTARLKLVGIAETQYNENAAASGSVQNDALTALYSTDDGKMDDLHVARDQLGADLVCLALGRSDFASTGLAFVLEQPGENTNPLFGFSVVQYSAIAGTSLVSHELGHNFGCAHDREHTIAPGAYSYSYGYRFTASNGRQYHDIMSYDPGTALSFFSNPALNAPAPAPENSPGGVAAGSPGETNTALTIEQSAFEVATFRLQTQTAATAGTLVNVSTLAFVGPGDQALIGGFVIDGIAPKKMLLRAAGPALNAFVVAGGTLPDPILDLYGGAVVLQSNDNWSSPLNGVAASEVAAAAAAVGAFPFADGSADAALLVTLPPGSYTTLVRGAGGRTGTALIESYEVGAAGNRVVNLSTRGYADNAEHPMVGGFVVGGTAGVPKRILIRVRGPSLVRDFNIPGGMNDPCLELRNAAGELLLKNDDWSTGTVAGMASAVNDFKPLVKSYSEQKIVATGFAPANRREPCVLVDLPPGSYTVTVKPFELRDPDPKRDEPAQPGVALLEVFEINR